MFGKLRRGHKKVLKPDRRHKKHCQNSRLWPHDVWAFAYYFLNIRTLNVRLRTVFPDSRADLPTMISPFNNIVHFKLSRDGDVFSSYVSWKDLITLLGCVVTSSPSLKTIYLSKGPRQNLMPGDFDLLRQLIQERGVVCSLDHLRFELRSMKKMEKRSVYLYTLLSFLVGISKSTELVLQDRDSPLLYRDRPRPEDEYDIKFEGQVGNPLLPDSYEPRLRELRWEIQWMPLRLRQYTNQKYLEKVKVLEYQAPIIRLMRRMEEIIGELVQFKELEEFRFHSTQVPNPSDDENRSTGIMDKWLPFAERIFNSLPRLRSVRFYGEYAETGIHNGDFEYQRAGTSEEKRHKLQVRPIFTK